MDSTYFSKLIAPCRIADFWQFYWESENYLHVEREDAHYYNEVLTAVDIDTLLQNQQLNTDLVKVLHRGDWLAPHHWQTLLAEPKRMGTHLLNPAQVIYWLGQGASLVLNAAELSIPPLVHFVRHLQRELQYQIRANIYITPPHAQAFRAHADDHDVFVMQISGTKVWRLYDAPVPLYIRRGQEPTFPERELPEPTATSPIHHL